MIHELKTWPEYFEAVLVGTKTFEYRQNDRNFRVGDSLRLREWDPFREGDDRYTGRDTLRTVTYKLPILNKDGTNSEYVILALSRDS